MAKLTDKERVAIASRWTEAMSKKAVTPLKALAEVLDDDVRTTNLTGKSAVLDWMKTSPLMSMFRTGSWQKPSVDGDIVRIDIKFDAKAAYYSATVSITVAPPGLITFASAVIRPAPDPLGSVILRVWGPRSGIDRLPEHLNATYGVTVKKTTALQQGNHGVYRVDLAKGGPWVVRVFPADRPIAGVRGDAAVLRFLEEQDFPAERCVADVSVHEGQGVLVTDFIKGSKPKPATAVQEKFADLLGRLHSMTGAPKAVRRPSGALHLYTVDCTVRNEIDTALASLDAGAFRGTDKRWESLKTALESADDFSSLPKAFVHPDPGCENAISSGGRLVLFDWTGAGHGPRVLGIGLLLTAAAQGKSFNREWADAIMQAYTKHVTLKPAELERLEDAVSHRLLIHEAYYWGLGMATRRKPMSSKAWPENAVGIAKMADHLRRTWA